MAAQAPFYKPSLPFTGPIYGGLRDGQVVVLSGSVLPSCKRFHVNFQCGTSQAPRSDVAFHFNPRFDDENCVVANSFERGSWQREERKNEMPFRRGQAFEIRFLVNNSAFMVAVDGKHFLEFKHRIPFFRVDTIGVSGGLDVASISFQSPVVPTVWSATSAPMVHAPFPPNPVFPPGPAYLTVPYRASIMGGIFPSKSIVVEGTPHPGATRFHINLKAGSNTVFHLNPRFNENVIVRNAKFNNSWGSEERFLPSGMPLSRGQPFSIWILCEMQRFRVAVNGQHQFDYNHRVTQSATNRSARSGRRLNAEQSPSLEQQTLLESVVHRGVCVREKHRVHFFKDTSCILRTVPLSLRKTSRCKITVFFFFIYLAELTSNDIVRTIFLKPFFALRN